MPNLQLKKAQWEIKILIQYINAVKGKIAP